MTVQGNFYIALAVITSLMVPGILYMFYLRKVKRAVDKPIKKKDTSVSGELNVPKAYYIGICPNCRGEKTEGYPCIVCNDEPIMDIEMLLSHVAQGFPDFFDSSIKKIKLKSGRVVFK